MTLKFEAKVTAGGDELDILMYGPIGSSWFEDGITAPMISRVLKENPRAKTIRVRLNSPGGLIDEGLTIRSILAQLNADTEAHIEGIAASAASVIAMGCKRILMHEGTTMMVHEASTMTRGDSRQHERSIAALAAHNDGMAEIYATRTGLSKEECRKMMADETWLTPAKAKQKGFSDEVVKGRVPRAAAVACREFDLSKYGYQHVPPEWALTQLRAVAQLAEETEDEMNYARIAIALGLSESADENTILNTLDKSRTASARDRAALNELCELTGKDNATEALGVARAHAQDHSKLEDLRGQLAAKDRLLEDQERASIISADESDPKGRKLTPAMIEFWKGEPVAKLKAFMATASYVVTAVRPRTPPSGNAPAADGTQANIEPTSAASPSGNKAFGDMEPAERLRLKKADPERYQALRAEWKSEQV